MHNEHRGKVATLLANTTMTSELNEDWQRILLETME